MPPESKPRDRLTLNAPALNLRFMALLNHGDNHRVRMKGRQRRLSGTRLRGTLHEHRACKAVDNLTVWWHRHQETGASEFESVDLHICIYWSATGV